MQSSLVCFQGNPANAVCFLPNVFHLSEPESMNGKTSIGIGDLLISDKFWCSPLSVPARPHASHLNQHLCLAQRKNIFIVTRNLVTGDSLFQVLIIETKHDLEHRPNHHHQAVHWARQHMEEGEEWSVVNIEAFYWWTHHRWNYAMVTGDEDLMIINNTINHVQLHTQQVTLTMCSYQLRPGFKKPKSRV